MKKKITKIWGVGLVLVLAASLLLAAAPVSAGTLNWGDEDLPEEIESGNITDMSVSPGGGVIYIAHDSGKVFRSTNSGESWSSITVVDGTNIMTDPTYIAVAPDDENYIATANAAGGVFISDDAGANWDSLGDALTAGITTLRDLALSPEKGGRHTVAVAAEDTGAEVWHYKIGAVGAAWDETSDTTDYPGFDPGNEWCGAVAFSPNFASDEVMVAVTADQVDEIILQIFSFNQENWNSGTFADYPAQIVDDDTDANVDALHSASIAMAPDYLGSDDSLRIVFVGITANSAASEDEASGMFRMDDDDVTELKLKKFIHSVAFDGTRLVAGRYDSNAVRRSADPLASSPSTSGSTSMKGPGGEIRTVVAFAGNDVVAGTQGDESAFAISRDDGKTFNDISLIDTVLANLEDVAVTPDGEMTYLLTNDGAATDNENDLSVWRLADSWERVLSLKFDDSASKEDFIIRIAPDDGDVLYLAERGSATASTIYYTTDGGASKWHTRVSRYDINDLAVEADGDVAYVLEWTSTTSAHVSKSTNAGFTWATKVSHKLSDGANMIVSIGEDEILVAGDGKASYSTDGNVTWTKLSDGMPDGADVQAIAGGLDDGDFVYAVTNTAAEDIYRWEIGEDDEWDDIGVTATGYQGSGIGLWEGVLYVVSYNTTGGNSQLIRSLDPTSDDPGWSTVDEAGDVFDVAPSALRASAAPGLTKLWAIDSVLPALVSFKDTLATVGPTLTGPRDGMEVPMNPVSGEASHVTLTWSTPSDEITAYDLEIALDSDFDEDVLSSTDQNVPKATGSWDEGDIISAVVGPGAARSLSFMPDTTYYWRVRVDGAGPVKSAWSDVRTFALGELEVTPPVIIQPAPPAPVITVPPAPAITIQPPEIVLPQPEIVLPAPQVTLPPAPAPVAPIPGWALYVIIIIGAVLVIALVVLILRTRRPV